MKVVLLAAGLGSRLGAVTADLPKALISVGGRTLLAHALRFAARLQPAEIVVVGGFGFPLVAAEVDARRAEGGLPPIALVENRTFRDGNLVSLLSARAHLDDEFVLMNIDHIYRPAIAAIITPPAGWVTAFVDVDRTLGADDMKVQRDATGRIARIAKTLETWDAGYVGMTRVPRAALARYFAEADAALAEEGRAIHVERILGRLATSGDPPRCRDISGHGWLEVDTPDERAHAEEALRGPGWS